MNLNHVTGRRTLLGAVAVLVILLPSFGTAAALRQAGPVSSASTSPVNILTVSRSTSAAVAASSITQLVISNDSMVVYAGPMPSNHVVYLPSGEQYSFYAYAATIGFDAVLATINGPSMVTIPLGPYTQGTLINTQTGANYSSPTDPSVVLSTVFGINQPDTIPAVNVTSAALTSDALSPRPDTGGCDENNWILYNTYDFGVQDQLQGAVYSWGENATDQVVNSPTPSQYTAAYSETSYDGGAVSETSATTYSVTSTETLATAQTYLSNGDYGSLWNYDVYQQGTWYDYVYHYMICDGGNPEWDGEVNEVMEMEQGGNFYKYDNSATSTSDYSFTYFYNLAVGDQPSQQVELTRSTVGTQSQSFSIEASISVNPTDTGGDFSGSFNVAGYTSLNSETSGSSTMYTLTGYDQCGSFRVSYSGWVLGFYQGSPSC